MGRRGVEPDNASCLNWLQPLYANQTPDPVSQQNLAIDMGSPGKPGKSGKIWSENVTVRQKVTVTVCTHWHRKILVVAPANLIISGPTEMRPRRKL